MSDSNIKYDICVCCGIESQEPEDQQIDYRNYYVDGTGQLCEKCYIEVYGNYTH